MKPSKFSNKLSILLTGLIIFTTFTASALNRYSVATGTWASTATWAATSGGASGVSAPIAGDVVFIENNFTVTIGAAAACLTLNIASGSTLIVGGFTLTVSGVTTLGGTMTFNSATGTKTFTGNVVITGNWNETAAAVFAFGGNLQNGGTFTASTGTHTFSGAARTISGANPIAIPSLTLSGTTTNNGTLTVSTTLAGASTLTNGATGTLNFDGSTAIAPTLTATAAGNTVNYTRSGAQSVKATTYSNLIISGSGTKTATGITAALNLTVSAGAVFNTGATATWTLTVSGTTSVSGTLEFTNAATKTFTGDITVNSGGIWTIDNITNAILATNITVSAGAIMRHYVNYASSNIITMTGNLDISGTYDYTGFTPAIFMNAPSGTRTVKTGTTSVFYLLLRTATYNANGPVTVDGPFYAMWNVNAGSFHTNGQTVIANWGVVNSGGTLFVDGGSLTINGANGGLLSGFATGGANAAVTVSSGTLNTTGINMGASPLVSTFTHSGGTITTTSLTIDNTSTYTCSNSPSLTVNGTVTIFSGTFTTASTGTPIINISGDLTTASGSIFSNISGCSPNVTIDGNVNNAGTLTTAGTATIGVKGNWNNNGTSTATGGTVTFNGTGNQSIGGTSTTTFGSFVINPSVGITVSVTNAISVLSNLTLTAGTFNSNSFNIQVGGNWINNSAFTAGTGTVTFNGASPQLLSGSQTLNLFNLVTNNPSGITLNADLSVSGAHTFTAGNITTSITPNYLIYQAGSSYSGDADSRHVNGWVKKFGSTNFIIPVGDATYERTASVTNLSAVSEVNCHYYRTTQNRFNIFSPIVFVDSAEYWQIDRISGGTFKIALNWDNSKVPFGNVLLVNVHGANYTTGLWRDIAGTPTGTPATTGTLTLTNNVGVGISPFTFGFTSWALPLEIISFSAQRRSDISFLNWTTENEFNLDHFEIERSDDGIHFYSIGTMAARNLSRQEAYTYSDRNSIQRIAWYRLVSVDNDGRKSYSKLVAVSVSRTDADLKLLVNPVISQILLEAGNNLSGLFDYRLSLPNGQQVQAGKLEIRQGGLQIIPISAYINPGTYILEVSNMEKRFNYKVVLK